MSNIVQNLEAMKIFFEYGMPKSILNKQQNVG